MAARPIIIDTDPGHDDAVAILLALASPELTVLGITAVAGNVPLPLTQRNARIICELADRTDIPVFAGCPRPMVRELITAEQVHGKSGLDGPKLAEPSMPLQDRHAVDWIIDTARRQPARSLTLCMLGPLTNLATAIVMAPDIVGHLQEVVLMGGGFFEGGNATPTAEFNIAVDPHAAHRVLDSARAAEVPVTMMPLDVTHRALMTDAWIAGLSAMGNRTGAVVAELMTFYERFDIERYGQPGGPLHDPMVIAYLLQPDLFVGRHRNVQVEIASELTMGMTVVDWWGQTGRPVTAHYMRQVDAAGYFKLLSERLARLP